MKLRRTSRRLLSALAAVAVGLVGVFVVASPAQAHKSDVQPFTYCDGEQSKVAFDIFSKLHGRATHVMFVHVGGDFTAAQLGIDLNHHYPITSDTPNVMRTSGVNVVAGQEFELSIRLAWFTQDDGGWSKRYEELGKKYGKGKGTDCHVPEAPKVSFVDSCDNIRVTFQSEEPKIFKLVFEDGSSTTADSPSTESQLDIDPSQAPLKAYYVENGNDVAIEDGEHTYTKPEFCGAPSGFIESTCDGLLVSLTNPADGKSESVSQTYTPSTGDPKTLTATRGQTVTHTFAGSEGLTVSYTPLDGGDKQTVTWEPDPEKCTPTTTTTPGLPDTGTGGLTGIIAAGAALVLAGAGLLTMLFLRRRRVSAES